MVNEEVLVALLEMLPPYESTIHVLKRSDEVYVDYVVQYVDMLDPTVDPLYLIDPVFLFVIVYSNCRSLVDKGQVDYAIALFRFHSQSTVLSR